MVEEVEDGCLWGTGRSRGGNHNTVTEQWPLNTHRVPLTHNQRNAKVHSCLHHMSKVKGWTRKLSGCPKPLILCLHFDDMFQKSEKQNSCFCPSITPPITYPMGNNYLCIHRFLVAVFICNSKTGTSYMLKNKVRRNTSSHLKSHCKG